MKPSGATRRRSPATSCSQPLPVARCRARPPWLPPVTLLSMRRGAAAEPRSPDPSDSSIRSPRRNGWAPLGCLLRSRRPADRSSRVSPALRAGWAARGVGRRAAGAVPKAKVSIVRSVPALARNCSWFTEASAPPSIRFTEPLAASATLLLSCNNRRWACRLPPLTSTERDPKSSRLSSKLTEPTLLMAIFPWEAAAALVKPTLTGQSAFRLWV